jgi:hypothetical protein
MNATKKVGDAGRSGLTRSKLFGALGHVHNPFSMSSHKDHDVEGYTQDDSARSFRATNLQAEISRAEANLMLYNLIARIQKS